MTASIVSVADASWDPMVSDRPYHDGMSAAQAEAILAGGAGAQWRPRAVEVLLAEIHEQGPVRVPSFRDFPRARHDAAVHEVEDRLAACVPATMPSPPAV